MKVVTSARLRNGLDEQLIQNHPDTQFYFYKNMSEAYEDLLDAEIFMTYGDDLTDEIIESVKNLRWIMVISAGLDNMPLKAIKEKGRPGRIYQAGRKART